MLGTQYEDSRRRLDNCSPALSLLSGGRQVILNISVGLSAGAERGSARGAFAVSGGAAKATPTTKSWSTQVRTRPIPPVASCVRSWRSSGSVRAFHGLPTRFFVSTSPPLSQKQRVRHPSPRLLWRRAGRNLQPFRAPWWVCHSPCRCPLTFPARVFLGG